ncbi:YrdB family protein [Levilactobacillus enshiensis]|uniref:YrdB family protein n=1 Tax=Levilactobacillus enshiensis TaxID=2590213 RepID=UPI00117A73EB|nr:YrdB family protein [Levilactobacillus enshiensis]
MTSFFQINALLRFFIELVTLMIITFLGLSKYKLPVGLLLGILVPIIVYVVWATYMAPLSPHRAGLLGRIAIEIIIFGWCDYLLITQISVRLGIMYGVVVGLNAIVAHIGDGLEEGHL